MRDYCSFFLIKVLCLKGPHCHDVDDDNWDENIYSGKI